MDADEETWSIQEVARRAGATSRALRHYHAIGLLEPTEIAPNGYRRYGADALVRLQRILLLRDLGVGLPQIADIVAARGDVTRMLTTHVRLLEHERDRLTRQIASVQRTIDSIDDGRNPMEKDMFDGFDHTAHEAEVTRRWGAETYRASNDWWVGLSAADKAEWQSRSRALIADWVALAQTGVEPAGPEARELAARHVAWLSSVPGTPGAGGAPVRAYVEGLAEMYVADERFTATYGGPISARFVRDALVDYADRSL